MTLRCTRRLLALLALIAAVFAAPVFAAGGPSVQRVGIERPSTSTGAYRVGIDGSAPAGCVPRVEGVTLDGADISIVLTAPATACQARSVPFHLKVDPAAAAHLRSLPAQVYRVRVYSGAGATPHLTAFALVDTSSAALAPVPESGFWWAQSSAESSATAGSGMSLELQDNQLAVSLLGFSETGAPTWYFGSTTLAGHVARIPLVQLANGDEWFSAVGTQPDMQPGPRLEIELLSPARARAYLVRSDAQDDIQVRTLTLARSTFATGPVGTSWTGRWVLVPEDGGNTRLFDFTAPSHRDAESFRLVDNANDATLDCRLIAGTQQADACTLTSAATPIADFDQVGYDHFTGRGINGVPVQLLRVPR